MSKLAKVAKQHGFTWAQLNRRLISLPFNYDNLFTPSVAEFVKKKAASIGSCPGYLVPCLLATTAYLQASLQPLHDLQDERDLPNTIGKLYLVSGTLIYIMCYSSEGVTAVCRSVRFVRIVSAVFGPYTIGKLYLVSGTYHVLFKRRRHSGLSIRTVCTDRKRKEIINRRDTATTNKPNNATSFFKGERQYTRQYDPFGAKA